jgi:23S rRNA (cytosine1962-C5)-methyltransferase
MALLVNQLPPCVLHEDEHLLVVNKPPGLNTHSPSPYGGEGLYDWLRNREPRWANLAIIHRLDKATSGLILFAKTKLANQSLTQQFTERRVQKRYLFLTTVVAAEQSFTVRSGITRIGDRYAASHDGERAETKFTYLNPIDSKGCPGGASLHAFAAEPLTGRTHQIRVHAELRNIPILGDTTYNGAPFPRVCLHAEELTFTHPATNKLISFHSQPVFFAPPHTLLRSALIEASSTNAFRLIHGAADNYPDLYLDQWADYFLVQSGASSSSPLRGERAGVRGEPPEPAAILSALPAANNPPRALYHKLLTRTVSRTRATEAQPQLISGDPAPNPFTIRENAVRYEISFQQGYSVGLFLDQRENRRRLLSNYVAPNFMLFENGFGGRDVLNTFAYTCGFSVCAALAGARTTSVDLSKKYLDWGKRNFTVNNLDPAAHDFIFGDLFDWAPRLAKKSRAFDLILLDPPTFSRSKTGIFQAEKHYAKLVSSVLPLLRPAGMLFASANVSKLAPEDFLAAIRTAVLQSNRRILQEQYIPQPPDFPITKEEPAYLKTAWLRIS